jgi:hypothetical protein
MIQPHLHHFVINWGKPNNGIEVLTTSVPSQRPAASYQRSLWPQLAPTQIPTKLPPQVPTLVPRNAPTPSPTPVPTTPTAKPSQTPSIPHATGIPSRKPTLTPMAPPTTTSAFGNCGNVTSGPRPESLYVTSPAPVVEPNHTDSMMAVCTTDKIL